MGQHDLQEPRVHGHAGRRGAEARRRAGHRAGRMGRSEPGPRAPAPEGILRLERPLRGEGSPRVALPPLLLHRSPRRIGNDGGVGPVRKADDHHPRVRGPVRLRRRGARRRVRDRSRSVGEGHGDRAGGRHRPVPGRRSPPREGRVRRRRPPGRGRLRRLPRGPRSVDRRGARPGGVAPQARGPPPTVRGSAEGPLGSAVRRVVTAT
mmetsp:Transcript_23360/g.55289  ORF Transcript_23360/g.55289 Transcript_23360/m.55289 type:complete len:207 (-) Transcript_23360:412-1032(-)